MAYHTNGKSISTYKRVFRFVSILSQMKPVHNLSRYSDSSTLILFFRICLCFANDIFPLIFYKYILYSFPIPYQGVVHSYRLFYFFVLITYTEECRLHIHYDLVSLLRTNAVRSSCALWWLTPCVVGCTCRLPNHWRKRHNVPSKRRQNFTLRHYNT